MIYAGIGSRETPEHILHQMRGLAYYLETKRYHLRSGGADGADKAFEEGQTLGLTEIYTASDHLPLWTNVFTDFFHPNPTALSPYARKLMNRNAMQILGDCGDDPVDFVVCWTKGGKKVGGTAQAMRIAEHYNIPIYNLAIEGELEKIYANY